MSKRTMTPEEAELFSELKSLVSKANGRLARLEKLTGEKGTFAAKSLYDLLSSSTVKGVTKSGRISLRKSYNDTQLRAIKKATERFLSDKEGSTVRGVKKYTKDLSKRANKPFSYSQASDFYQARYNYKWIYEYLTESEFWAFVKVAKENGWNEETFIQELEDLIDVPDEDFREKISALYYYVMGED